MKNCGNKNIEKLRYQSDNQIGQTLQWRNQQDEKTNNDKKINIREYRRGQQEWTI